MICKVELNVDTALGHVLFEIIKITSNEPTTQSNASNSLKGHKRHHYKAQIYILAKVLQIGSLNIPVS